MDLRIDDNIFERSDNKTLVVGHGVNVRGLMGAGFAKLVADRYPNVKKTYVMACMDGTLTMGQTQLLVAEPGVWVANIASQERPGRDAREVWLSSALDSMYLQLRQHTGPHGCVQGNLQSGQYTGHINVRLPLIGAGIGGLDPVRAADIILAASNAHDSSFINTTLYLLSGDSHTEKVSNHLARRQEIP